MKEYKSLYDVWRRCFEIGFSPVYEIKKVRAEEFAYLYCSAGKYILEEVNKLAKELGFVFPIMTKIPIRKRNKSNCLAKYNGDVVIYFQTLFECDYKGLVSILIHELCHSVYGNHTKPFWLLFEKCLKEKKIISQDYDGWNKNSFKKDDPYMYLTPFYYQKGISKYSAILKTNFSNYCVHYRYLVNSVYEKYQEYKKLIRYTIPEPPQEYHGELVYIGAFPIIEYFRKYVSTLYIFELDKLITSDYKALIYLRNEKDLLYLQYETRVKSDQMRIPSLLEQIKDASHKDLIIYNSCFIILMVDDDRPLDIKDLEKVKNNQVLERVNSTIAYCHTSPPRYLNKCIMIMLFSK